MKLRWNKMGGQLGLLFCLAGLIFIWVGWNGAASYNDLRQQFPWLISGGITGLALVIIGVGLFVVQSQRADRVQLEANLVELRRILDRMTGASAGNGSEPAGAVPGGPAVSPEIVVAGPNAYHRPSCRLVQGRRRPSRAGWRPAAPAPRSPSRSAWETSPPAPGEASEDANRPRPPEPRQPWPYLPATSRPSRRSGRRGR